MKSLLALSAAVLLSSALAHGTAQACSQIYVPNGLGRLALVGADALPLDSGIVLTATYRKVGDGDALDALKVEVTGDDGAVPGKATIVSRASFVAGAENVVIRWLPDAPFTAGEDVRVKLSVTQPQPSEPISPIERTFRVTETKLADLVAPSVVIAGNVARETTDESTPRATCKIAEAQPGMCGPGMEKGSEISFPSQLRNVPHFLVDVTRTIPPALEPFVRYDAGDSPLYSSSGRQEVSVGNAPAGSEHCVEVSASTIVGDVVRTAKACAIVPETPPVSDAKQKEYLANATRLCATGSITPEAVAEEAETAKGNGASSSSTGCNASGRESSTPVAAIAAVAALVALRRRAKKAGASAT